MTYIVFMCLEFCTVSHHLHKPFVISPSECLSVPPVNTEADDDLSSPITSIAPLKGQGYFIVSKSAGTRIAVRLYIGRDPVGAVE